MKGLNGGRIGIAAQSLGIAEGAFELALKYSKERKTMGKLISEHQLIQAKLAQMSMKISAAELLTLKAAWLKDNGKEHMGTELEFVIMVIAVSCVKLLSAHNSTQHTSRKHKV
jgi:Acyl-CoA dehydrogenases